MQVSGVSRRAVLVHQAVCDIGDRPTGQSVRRVFVQVSELDPEGPGEWSSRASLIHLLRYADN